MKIRDIRWEGKLLSDNKLIGKKVKDVTPDSDTEISEFVICGIDLEKNCYICADLDNKCKYPSEVVSYGDEIYLYLSRFFAISKYEGFQAWEMDEQSFKIKVSDFLSRVSIEW